MKLTFFNTILKEKFPHKYDRRLEWASSPMIKKKLKQFDHRIYGSFSPEMVAPFISAFGCQLPLIGRKLDVPHFSGIIQLREYLFIRKLSEIVGKRLQSDGGCSQEATIELGRSYIDRNRYIRTNDFHRKMVEIFGGRDTKYLFQLKAHAEPGDIDQAMLLLDSHS